MLNLKRRKSASLGLLLAVLFTLGCPWPAQTAEPQSASRLSNEELRWMASSSFKSPSDGDLLDSIMNDVRTASANHTRPIVIFDLDDTVFDNQPSARALLKAWLKITPNLALDVRMKLERVGVSGSSPAEIFSSAGLSSDHPDFKAFKDFVFKKFFTDRFASNSTSPFRGVVKYAKTLQAAGAHIVYLTGRPESSMRQGTLAALRSVGMPLESESDLLMKPDADNIADFKRVEMSRLKDEGPIVAFFDNEPSNLEAGKAVLGDSAKMVLFTTKFENLPSSPIDGLYRIGSWSQKSIEEAPACLQQAIFHH